ncbi:MAG: DUF2721 domain-containing protein [Opitutaceae bacterium]|nr:DUF2721 domain-containing protein [Opitutaceae bacterium]
MDHPVASNFLPVIQLAITPVILISGVGALMLTLTNRMGRVVDRTRALAEKVRSAGETDRVHFETQLAILWRRAKLIRIAVTLAALSMLLSCLLVMAIFADASMARDFGAPLVIIFLGSVVCLAAALIAFLRDVWMSLWALRLEVERARGPLEG